MTFLSVCFFLSASLQLKEIKRNPSLVLSILQFPFCYPEPESIGHTKMPLAYRRGSGCSRERGGGAQLADGLSLLELARKKGFCWKKVVGYPG